MKKRVLALVLITVMLASLMLVPVCANDAVIMPETVPDQEDSTSLATEFLDSNFEKQDVSMDCYTDGTLDGVNIENQTLASSQLGPLKVSGGKRNFKWPVPGNYGLSSCFYDGRGHYAIDIPAASGTSVVASYNGTVEEVTYNGSSDGGYGNAVMLKHSYTTSSGNTVTLYTRYAHMSSISVSKGQTVYAGQTVVGKVGGSGYGSANYYANHLDFQILTSTNWRNRSTCSIDPFANYLLELPSNIYTASTRDCCGVGPTGCCCNTYIKEAKALYANTPPTNDTTITLSGANYPTKLNVGQAFSIQGTVTSGVNITSLTVGVYDSSSGGNMKTGKTVYPNSTSYNIKNVDADVLFNKLAAGIYYYRITATNSAGTKTLMNQQFTVGKNSEIYKPSKPALTGLKSTYNEGDSIVFNWNATSNTTHYNFWLQKWDTSANRWVNAYKVDYASSGLSYKLNAGDYRALVQSTNSNYWTDDGSTWLYTDSDYVYFTVKAVQPEFPSGKCGDNLTWTLKDGTLTISGTGPMYNYSSSSESAPWDTEDVKKVIINNGATNIGSSAFSGCSNLTSVSIPSSVTQIMDYAFKGCSGLTSISIPGGVTWINRGAFYGCSSLSSVSLPSSVTYIGNSAFQNCSGLTSVSIPSSVTYIDGYAFTNCSNLTSVSIPDGVTSIGTFTFYGCSKLTSVSIPDSVTYIGDYAFTYCSKLTNVSIPSNVTYIGKLSFDGCSSLTSVSIPSGVTSIEMSAFAQCYNLTSVSIPSGVTSIGNSAFERCDKLADVYYDSTKAQWDKINIGTSNEPLLNANIHYNAGASSKPTPGTHFIDVPAGAYYADAVNWAVGKGVTSGTSATAFSPDNPCTRGQIVTFLWRANGSPKPTSSKNPFKDVAAGAYYYDAVLWAVEKEITSGTSATTFSPNDTCTRAQAVTFQYRAAGSPAVSSGRSFSDVSAGAYYGNAVKWAVANNITSGTGNNKFSPNDTCSRAQIVTFLYRQLM